MAVPPVNTMEGKVAGSVTSRLAELGSTLDSALAQFEELRTTLRPILSEEGPGGPEAALDGNPCTCELEETIIGVLRKANSLSERIVTAHQRVQL